MASLAVNYRSFMNALGNRIGVSSDYLHKFITSSNTNYSRLLSVKEACSICEVFLTKMNLYDTTLTPTNRNSLSALSVNTAKAILDYYIDYYTWTIASDSASINNLNSGTTYKVLTKNTTGHTTTLSATLVGGGAGGNGGVSCHGSKYFNCDVRNWYAMGGSASTISINGSVVATAAGGAQKMSGSNYYVDKNYGKECSANETGVTGNSGSTATSSITLTDGDSFVAVKGRGANGTGGLVLLNDCYTSDGNRVSTGNMGSAYGTAGSFDSDYNVFAGSGGGGGLQTDYTQKSNSTTSSGSGTKGALGEMTTTLGVVAKGGTGGTSSALAQTAQSSTAGAGGVGGAASGVNANGGNGGNSGTVTGTTSHNVIYLIIGENYNAVSRPDTGDGNIEATPT